MLATKATQAQRHVEHALERLMACPNARETLNSHCLPSAVPGECESRYEYFQFTVPLAEREVVDAMYEAFDQDSLWCTQYRWQDAFSAHNRPIDIEVPSYHLRTSSEDKVNVLWGGFFNIDGPVVGHFSADNLHRLAADSVFAPGLTLYRDYVLQWWYDGQGNIQGNMQRITFPANTQRPCVRPVSEPKYAPLLRAIRAFTMRKDVPMSRSLSFRRAAADGQWTHLYNTYGFNIPLSMERDVLLPLYDAFEQTKHRSYRYLNKPAGETAADVQIVINEQGRTIGLGLQTDWNIVYAYFTDEDYPRNRYVYALWYRADVPRRRIVGELIAVNTERPDGGTLVQPYVQRTVPTYLWRLSAGDVPQQTGADMDALRPPLNLTLDMQDMRTLLSVGAPGSERYNPDLTAKMRQRGMDVTALYIELDTMRQRAQNQRTAMIHEMDVLTESYHTGLHNIGELLKVNMPSAAYSRMSEQERRQYLDNVRQDYQRQTDELGKDYRQKIQALPAKYPGTNVQFFDPDGQPTAFTRRVAEGLMRAFRGDGSLTDEDISELLRQFAEFTTRNSLAPYRESLAQSLDTLRHKTPSSVTRCNFDEAISTLRDDLNPMSRIIFSDELEHHASAATPEEAPVSSPSSSAPSSATPGSVVGSSAADNSSASRQRKGTVTLTLPNGNTLTAGKIKAKPLKGSVLGTLGPVPTVRQGKRIIHRAERRLRRMERKLARHLR